MKYAVIGMGAVGGYYGSRLAQHGLEVHFLVRSEYEYISQYGYTVDSCLGDYHLDNLQVYRSPLQMPQCDVVLVCTKTTSNDHLSQLIAPILKTDTLVVLVQNGIGIESVVQQQLPSVSLAAGVAFINAVRTAPGHILHARFGHITLGNYSCSNQQILQQVAQDFCSSQVPCTVADYAETRWRKAILNIATNGVTVLLNARCDQLIANPASRQLVYDLMLEGVHAAQACGVNLPDEYADQLLSSTSQTVFATSMKYDYDHHLAMEIEYLYTRPILEAERNGCAVPKLKMLEQQLRYLDSINLRWVL